MAMRLQELHPALVHYPIALMPTALAADALGRLTGSPTLLATGRRLIAATAVTGAISGAAGLLAQEGSRFDEETRRLLITHRNLNVALVALTGWMAKRRLRADRPSMRYLALGVAGLGALFYSAYLGGVMVYHHGVGVAAAGGLREDQAPELRPENAAEIAEVSRHHIREGLKHAAADLARGQVAPALRG